MRGEHSRWGPRSGHGTHLERVAVCCERLEIGQVVEDMIESLSEQRQCWRNEKTAIV